MKITEIWQRIFRQYTTFSGRGYISHLIDPHSPEATPGTAQPRRSPVQRSHGRKRQ